MRGAPYVDRTNVWDKVNRHYCNGNEIVIGLRTWDGIDRPDYTEKFILTPDQARYVATELWKLAEQIDGKKGKESKLKQIRKNTEKIIKQAKKEAMK